MLPQGLFNSIILITLAAAPLFIIVWVIVFNKKRTAARRKNPINTHLLRSPGQTIAEEAEDLSIDLSAYISTIPYITLVSYASYLNSSKSALILYSLIFLAILGLVFVTYKIIKIADKRETLKLAYDAELAVGQELNLLMRQGYYVFHDVHLKNTISEFNIDHVVVGKTGVFAIETKGRSKPTKNSGKDSSKVSFDGQKLEFPQWEETEPVEQAKRQAVALQKWLTSAVGEAISVKGVIALPGWYTTSTSKKAEIAVINGKNPEGFFNAGDGELSEKQIKQIAHQLESLCRNVEPKAYTLPKN